MAPKNSKVARLPGGKGAGKKALQANATLGGSNRYGLISEPEAKTESAVYEENEGLDVNQDHLSNPFEVGLLQTTLPKTDRQDSVIAGKIDPDSSAATTEDDEGFTAVGKKKPQHKSTRPWLLPIKRDPESHENIMNKPSWRQKTVAASRLALSKFTHKTQQTMAIPKCVFIQELRRGLIVQHYVTTEYDGPLPATPEVFSHPDGSLYIRKLRIAIFKRIWSWSAEEHHVFSYQGKGLKNQPDDIKQESVGIRPLGISASEWKKLYKQNEHPPLVVKSMREAEVQIDPISTYQYSQTHVFKFDRLLRVLGDVELDSLARSDRLRGD